jgi:hypothetical protein
MTLLLSEFTLTNARLSDGALVAARIGAVAAGDVEAFERAAASLGMVSVGPNQFHHPIDHSWAVMWGVAIERGRGLERFRDAPTPLDSLPYATTDVVCAAAAIVSGARADVVAQLISAGFVEGNRFFFSHPDGSWVAMTPQTPLLRGFGQTLINVSVGEQTPVATRMLDVMARPTRSPRFADAFAACAQPGHLHPSPVVRDTEVARLAPFGFVEVEPGYFEHPDQSWIAFMPNSVERGVGGDRFVGLPGHPATFGCMDAPMPGFHLSAANAVLHAMTLADLQCSDAELLRAGFKRDEAVPTFYRHRDGCYIAFTSTKTYIGHGRYHFMVPPLPLDVDSAIPSRPEHAFAAIAKTAALRADENLPQSLMNEGFTMTLPGTSYSHADGSWIVVQGDSLIRGVDKDLLADVPAPPVRTSVVKDTSRPPLPSAKDWSYWERNTAIGKLPMLSGKLTDLLILDAAGFVLTADEWWHPDGSWVCFQQRPPLGWKGYHLGDLPYNNRLQRLNKLQFPFSE